MSDPARRSELVLIICFLAVIVCVPITQTWLEISHGERVQATDLFQQNLRPLMQTGLFHVFQHTGVKGMLGRDRWLFFRPDVRYLLEPDRLEPKVSEKDAFGLTWVQPSDETTRRESAIRTIVHFHNLLQARNIELLVMPVPGKPSIYPDKVTSRAENRLEDFRSPTLDVLAELKQQGIKTVDLFAAFRTAREESKADEHEMPLYLAQDTHWTPRGAKIAAQAVAREIRDLGWAPPENRRYQTSTVRVNRSGDILEMTQVPGMRQFFGVQEVECEQVRSSTGKLLIPSSSERAGMYKPPGAESPVLILGDSFCRIYQLPEPQTLGELPENSDGKPQDGSASSQEPSGSKRLLPGSAGFPSLLMRELKTPVDYIISDGGAATDVRKKLATNPEILEDKQVVVWEFVERDLALGREGWEEVPLPDSL
jgi:hypothetical protein